MQRLSCVKLMMMMMMNAAAAAAAAVVVVVVFVFVVVVVVVVVRVVVVIMIMMLIIILYLQKLAIDGRCGRRGRWSPARSLAMPLRRLEGSTHCQTKEKTRVK